jgi:hypothetical protein
MLALHPKFALDPKLALEMSKLALDSKAQFGNFVRMYWPFLTGAECVGFVSIEVVRRYCQCPKCKGIVDMRLLSKPGTYRTFERLIDLLSCTALPITKLNKSLLWNMLWVVPESGKAVNGVVDAL